MSKKKNKFDLTQLVHDGVLKEGQTVCFVSDPSKSAKVTKLLNGEFKLARGAGAPITVHAFAQECLGQEPPNHASVWVRTESGKTLYDLWKASLEEAA